MAFHKFQKLAPELRQWIWKEAILEEADERIFFVHAETFRILPTQNIICDIFRVNWEARQVALKHYPVEMPIFKLPSLNGPVLTFEEWVVQTAHVQWGRGGPWGIDSEEGRESWSNMDRYWHHYAMPKLGEAANQLIKNTPGNPQTQDSGCIHLSPVTDRFLLSHAISDRDNADEIVSWPASCNDLVVPEPDPDLCAYQMILDYKWFILDDTEYAEYTYEIPRRYMSPPSPWRCDATSAASCSPTSRTME
ncbi:hypothetical protein PG984_014699 [Apiospora sp. TS-2023a]